MLALSEAGKQILGNNPGNFYIFCGSEHGIKEKYISHLKEFYTCEYSEYPDVGSVLDLMRNVQLIPLIPQLYIVRYDESFLSTLKDSTASDIRSLNIIGTVVLLYHDVKSFNKCNKFLSDYTVLFDPVARQYIANYLAKDFPSLSKVYIEFAVKSTSDYKSAYTICHSLSKIKGNQLAEANMDDLKFLFSCDSVSVDEQIKLGVAARNFNYLIETLDRYPGDYDNILYTILNTLVDLDKLKCRNFGDSPLKPYARHWTQGDIYNMYMFTFNAIEQLRSISSDPYSQLVFLFSILQYQPIPPVSAMKGG